MLTQILFIQQNLGIIHEENTYLKYQTPSNVSILQLKRVADHPKGHYCALNRHLQFANRGNRPMGDAISMRLHYVLHYPYAGILCVSALLLTHHHSAPPDQSEPTSIRPFMIQFLTQLVVRPGNFTSKTQTHKQSVFHMDAFSTLCFFFCPPKIALQKTPLSNTAHHSLLPQRGPS